MAIFHFSQAKKKSNKKKKQKKEAKKKKTQTHQLLYILYQGPLSHYCQDEQIKIQMQGLNFTRTPFQIHWDNFSSNFVCLCVSAKVCVCVCVI